MPDDSPTPLHSPASLPRGLLLAAILCLACGLVIGLFTMRFVVAGFQGDNPLAGVALVYLLPSFAYCLGGYYLRNRRRAGAWVAILIAAFWSLPLWAYDGDPGFLWSGWSAYFLPANLAIILLVLISWRDLTPSTGKGGA